MPKTAQKTTKAATNQAAQNFGPAYTNPNGAVNITIPTTAPAWFKHGNEAYKAKLNKLVNNAGHAAKPYTSKPTVQSLQAISYINPAAPVTRKLAWPLYNIQGLTLAQAAATKGLAVIEIMHYVDHGMLKLTPPTNAQLAAAVAAWQKQQKTNPSKN